MEDMIISDKLLAQFKEIFKLWKHLFYKKIFNIKK